MYVYLSVENRLILGQLWYMFFILGLLSIEKLIQFDCCKGHLNKALIDQKHVYVYCLFGTGWMRGLFLNYSSKLKPKANKINIAIITTHILI